MARNGVQRPIGVAEWDGAAHHSRSGLKSSPPMAEGLHRGAGVSLSPAAAASATAGRGRLAEPGRRGERDGEPEGARSTHAGRLGSGHAAPADRSGLGDGKRPGTPVTARAAGATRAFPMRAMEVVASAVGSARRAYGELTTGPDRAVRAARPPPPGAPLPVASRRRLSFGRPGMAAAGARLRRVGAGPIRGQIGGQVDTLRTTQTALQSRAEPAQRARSVRCPTTMPVRGAIQTKRRRPGAGAAYIKHGRTTGDGSRQAARGARRRSPSVSARELGDPAHARGAGV
jgi:hypothetical protein